MKYEIAHRVHSEEFSQLIRIQHVSLGFAHFPVSLKQPRMSEDLLWKRQPKSHKEDGPVDRMKTDNILPDQVKIRRPELPKLLRTAAVTVIADSGNIVGQSIQPHVCHMLWIEGYRNSPFKGSSGNAEILKPRKKKVIHHLILPGHRLDKFRMGINMLNEPVRIFTHSKEIRFLFGRGHFPSAVRTFSIYQLGLCKEGFAGGAVKPLIVSFINISLVIQLLKNLLNLGLMILVCGTDEFIIGGIHQIPDPLDLGSHAVHKLLGSHAGFLGLQLNFLSVLIGTRLEKDIVPLHPFVPGDAVRQHDLIRISNMRLARCVGYGRS